jgi:lysophospholipase L1-like esterase
VKFLRGAYGTSGAATRSGANAHGASGEYRPGALRIGDPNTLTGPGTPAFVFNLKPSNISNLRAALRANSANIRIAIEGDSVIRGVDGAGANTAQYTTDSIHERLAAFLNADSMPATAMSQYGVSGNTLVDYLGRTNRVTTSGSVVLGSNKYLGGVEFRFTAAGNVTFTVNGVDTMRPIWGDQVTTGRTFSYKIDGGSAVNLTTSGVSQIRRENPISLGAVGTHTISCDWVAGTALLCGIEFYNSTRNEITVHNIALSGGVSANFIDNAGAPGQGRPQQESNFPFALVASEMGSVNDARTSVSVATFKSNMQTRVLNARANGADFIYIAQPWDNGTGTGNVANQQQYRDAGYQLAAQYDFPVLDLAGLTGGSYAASVANGNQAAGDNVHMTTAGKVLLARKLEEIIKYAR